MSIIESSVRFFQDGGIFMYPIALVLALGAAVAVERFLYLASMRRANAGTWEVLRGRLEEGDLAGALAEATQSGGALGRILAEGLGQARTGGRRADIEAAMEEGFIEIVPRLEKRTHYLGVLANVATLLGLLGTIIGLIQGFTAVSSASPAEKADLLSASISVAMNTTAFGLMVAIPLLLVHAFLQTRTAELIDGLEMGAIRLLNRLGRTTAGDPDRP